MDQFRFSTHRQDRCIPQSLGTLPHQRAVGEIRRPFPRRPLLPGHPSRHHSTQPVAIRGTPGNIQEATTQLFHPVPLLESLVIEAKSENPSWRCRAISTTPFCEDLSSLRELRLRSICTKIPRRNTVNLPSFALGYVSLGDSSVGPLLNFFESAPRPSKIQLHLATPTIGAQRGRVVSLACPERIDIVGGGQSSLLLDYSLIPVGAKFAGPLHLPILTSRNSLASSSTRTFGKSVHAFDSADWVGESIWFP